MRKPQIRFAATAVLMVAALACEGKQRQSPAQGDAGGYATAAPASPKPDRDRDGDDDRYGERHEGDVGRDHDRDRDDRDRNHDRDDDHDRDAKAATATSATTITKTAVRPIPTPTTTTTSAASTTTASAHAKVGPGGCKACHRVQHDSWMASAHAKKGLDCEGCHGNGADYRSPAVMRDAARAAAAGLMMPEVSFCRRCHENANVALLPKAHAHKAQ